MEGTEYDIDRKGEEWGDTMFEERNNRNIVENFKKLNSVRLTVSQSSVTSLISKFQATRNIKDIPRIAQSKADSK